MEIVLLPGVRQEIVHSLFTAKVSDILVIGSMHSTGATIS